MQYHPEVRNDRFILFQTDLIGPDVFAENWPAETSLGHRALWQRDQARHERHQRASQEAEHAVLDRQQNFVRRPGVGAVAERLQDYCARRLGLED